MVSIITPLYNSEKFISSAIQSVLYQTYQSWEMIIVDDCSTDKSYSIAKEYAQTDDRIIVVKLPQNSGPAVARNKAIELATGRFIAFLDSDDLWESIKLEKQISFMKESNCSLSYTQYSLIDQNGSELDEIIKPPLIVTYKKLLKSNYVGCLTAIYDAKKLGKVYMPNLKKRQDYGLWLKILKEIPAARCLPEVLASYRVRTNSISSSKVNVLKYNWKLFTEVEKLPRYKALYYLGYNIFKKFIKKSRFR